MRHITAFCIGVGIWGAASLLVADSRPVDLAKSRATSGPAKDRDSDKPPSTPPSKGSKSDPKEQPTSGNAPNDDDDDAAPSPGKSSGEKEVDAAEFKLKWMEKRLRRAEEVLDASREDKERLEAEFATFKQEETKLLAELRPAQAAADAATAELEKLDKRVEAIGAKLAEAKRVASAADDELRQSTKWAEERFAREPASVSRLEQLEAANRRLAAEQDRVRSKLMADPAHKQLVQTATRAEATVKAMRETTPADPAGLANASRAWIQSKGQLEAAERLAFKPDIKVLEAEELAAAARKTQADAVAAFKANLPNDPLLAPVVASATACKDAYAEAEEERVQTMAEVTPLREKAQAAITEYRQQRSRLQKLREERDVVGKKVLHAQTVFKAAREEHQMAKHRVTSARMQLEKARRQAGRR